MTLAIEIGLDRTPNGELIKAAEAQGFDVLLTPDKNIGYQQNLRGRRIGIVVLPSGLWPMVRNQIGEVVEAVDAVQSGSYSEVPFRKSRAPSP